MKLTVNRLFQDDKTYLDEAIAQASQTVELNPKFSDAYHRRGAIYLEWRQFEQAVSDFDKAVKLNPKDPEAYLNRGNTYADFDKARELGDKINDLPR